MIKAVTFDIWDTIVHDDSDEPKRTARGLRSKREERRHLLWEALNAEEPIGRDEVFLAYDVMEAAFNHVWHDQHVTWLIDERLRVALAGLGRDLSEGALAHVVQGHAEMEVDIPPDLIEGMDKAIQELSTRYKLGIVSDAIVTPGTGLRQLLDRYGLRQYFSGFAFSDEAGHSKPHRDVFDSVARQMGVAVEEMVHVGDRDHNDVKGPQAIGMKAVLLTASRDRDKDITTADAICARATDLPGIIDGLAAAEAA